MTPAKGHPAGVEYSCFSGLGWGKHWLPTDPASPGDASRQARTINHSDEHPCGLSGHGIRLFEIPEVRDDSFKNRRPHQLVAIENKDASAFEVEQAVAAPDLQLPIDRLARNADIICERSCEIWISMPKSWTRMASRRARRT